MQLFRELIKAKSKINRDLNLLIVNPLMFREAHKYKMQDLLRLTQIAKENLIINNIIFTADTMEPIRMCLDGHLLWKEVMGEYNVHWGLQLDFLEEISNEFDVRCYFDDDNTMYTLGDGLTILDEEPL